MPVSEDVTREMVSLFEDGARSRKTSIELTPLLLLKRVVNVGDVDVLEHDAFRGELAVCRSVMLTALDVTHGPHCGRAARCFGNPFCPARGPSRIHQKTKRAATPTRRSIPFLLRKLLNQQYVL